MNVFADFTEHVRAAVEALERAGGFTRPLDVARIVVEPPREAAHGDLATNAAMVLAKDAGVKPRGKDCRRSRARKSQAPASST